MDAPATDAATDGGDEFRYDTPGQYAAREGVNVHAVYRRIRGGKLLAQPVGRQYLIPRPPPATA